MEPDFNAIEDQRLFDEHRRTIRVLQFRGCCTMCNVRIYGFTDGENDPRGVLGDHAPGGYVALDDTKSESKIAMVICFSCIGNGENGEHSYIGFVRVLKKMCSQGWVIQSEDWKWVQQ